MRPADRKYLKSHEWVKIDDDIVVIGISDFAVKQLSDNLGALQNTEFEKEELNEIEQILKQS